MLSLGLGERMLHIMTKYGGGERGGGIGDWKCFGGKEEENASYGEDGVKASVL